MAWERRGPTADRTMAAGGPSGGRGAVPGFVVSSNTPSPPPEPQLRPLRGGGGGWGGSTVIEKDGVIPPMTTREPGGGGRWGERLDKGSRGVSGLSSKARVGRTRQPIQHRQREKKANSTIRFTAEQPKAFRITATTATM